MKIYKFYSDTCIPCKQLNKHLNELDLSQNIENINIADETNFNLIEKYSIMSVPTLLKIDDNGNEIKKEVGNIMITKLKNFFM